jgi:hypothetical protein
MRDVVHAASRERVRPPRRVTPRSCDGADEGEPTERTRAFFAALPAPYATAGWMPDSPGICGSTIVKTV